MADATRRDLADSATTPDWWRQAVVYQIYPRSFADANGDGIGDLPGITSRVDYLAALGIDAVWLSPFYPSALADGGYDVDDYRDVDPRLGTLDDFDEMVAALHDAGIRVVVDIVPNHTSNLHAWFQEALARRPDRRPASATSSATGAGRTAQSRRPTGSRSFGGSAWERVAGRPVVPALLRRRAARPQLAEPRGARGLRAHAAVLGGSRRRRIPHRCRAHAHEGPHRAAAEPGRARTRWPQDGTHPVHRPRRRARDLRAVARGVQRVRPAADRRRRGLGGALAPAAVRERRGPRAGVQLRPARGGLRRRAVPRHRHRQPRARGGVGLVVDVGAVEPRRRAARDPLRAAAPPSAAPDGRPTRQARQRVAALAAADPGARPRARARAARAPRRCSCSACPGPPTSTRARSSACTRSPSSTTPSGRIRRSSAAPASTSGGTDAACRCRGRPTGTSFGFGADGVASAAAGVVRPLCRGGRRRRIRHRCCRSTGGRSRCAAELQGAEELEWIDSGRDDVLWFRRPGGWEVVTNFGSRAVRARRLGDAVLDELAGRAGCARRCDDGVASPSAGDRRRAPHERTDAAAGMAAASVLPGVGMRRPSRTASGSTRVRFPLITRNRKTISATTPTMIATQSSQLSAEFRPPKIARMTAMTMMMMRARFMGPSPSVRRVDAAWRDSDASWARLDDPTGPEQRGGG